VVPGADVTKWRKVQDNLFLYNRGLSSYSTTQFNSGLVPTIAYEQNLIETIAQLRSRNPSVKIILCAPYWLRTSQDRRLNFRNYYDSLENIAKACTTTASPIIISHLNNAFDGQSGATDAVNYIGSDGLHLNTAGHKKVFGFTKDEGLAIYNANLAINSNNPAFLWQTYDNTYGGLKSIVDGNPSWFVNWIDI
jgi:hypothetical protein